MKKMRNWTFAWIVKWENFGTIPGVVDTIIGHMASRETIELMVTCWQGATHRHSIGGQMAAGQQVEEQIKRTSLPSEPKKEQKRCGAKASLHCICFCVWHGQTAHQLMRFQQYFYLNTLPVFLNPMARFNALGAIWTFSIRKGGGTIFFKVGFILLRGNLYGWKQGRAWLFGQYLQ